MTKQQRKAIAQLLDKKYDEDVKTKKLLSQLSHVKECEFLERNDAITILRWKSTRPTPLYERNSEDDFREITSVAFTTKHEGLKIHTLTALHGVSIPAASALLMFRDPSNYPVIDIRVWNELRNLNIVSSNARGQGFKLSEWAEYLTFFRNAASEFHVTVRELERSFFFKNREEQTGKIGKN